MLPLLKKQKKPETEKNGGAENTKDTSAKKQKKDLLAGFKTRSFRVGGYSVAAGAMVLAIVIVVNLLANALPAKYTRFDTTSAQLFTISQQTEDILSALDQDVSLYWVCQGGQEDSKLGNLLDRYSGMSSKIHVEKKDPNVNPTFIQQYVSSSVYNNSVIVVCGDRSRYVSYDEIYEYDYSSYYYDGTYSVNFAGEGSLTSAIAYVTNENLPKLYALSGHGEQSLSSSFSTAVEKENMELNQLSLLTVDQIPDDADCILIYSPQSDISAEEKDMLLTYLQSGGSLYYISNPAETEGQFANLEALMAEYGLSAENGIVIEADRNNYFIQGPLYLLPTLKYHEITAPLQDGGYRVMLPVAHGIQVDETLREGLSVTKLLTTSNSSFSKVAGYNLQTMEKESGDIDGPFALAVAAEDENNGSNVVWVSSAYLLDDSANAQVSGGNQDFFLNALGWMCDHEESISIHSKSLSYEYLTMDEGTASLLSAAVVGLIPLAYLGAGIIISLRRRRR